VGDDECFLRPQEPVRDDKRAEGVVGHESAGVSDDVGVSFVEAEELCRVEARIHAGHDRESTGRRDWEVSFVEALGVGSIRLEDLLARGHCLSLRCFPF